MARLQTRSKLKARVHQWRGIGSTLNLNPLSTKSTARLTDVILVRGDVARLVFPKRRLVIGAQVHPCSLADSIYRNTIVSFMKGRASSRSNYGMSNLYPTIRAMGQTENEYKPFLFEISIENICKFEHITIQTASKSTTSYI